jgi:hypothetical protein
VDVAQQPVKVVVAMMVRMFAKGHLVRGSQNQPCQYMVHTARALVQLASA